jgi:cell division protein FtsB
MAKAHPDKSGMEKKRRRRQRGSIPVDSQPILLSIEDTQRQRRERRAEALGTPHARRRTERAEAAVAVAAQASSRHGLKAAKRLVFLLVLLAVAGLCVFAFSRIPVLEGEKVEALTALTKATEQKERLESELSVLTDPEYIEAQARERLRMTKPNETLFVFEDEGEDNSQ